MDFLLLNQHDKTPHGEKLTCAHMALISATVVTSRRATHRAPAYVLAEPRHPAI